MMQLLDIISTRHFIRQKDQFLLALNILGGRRGPYRIPVLDESFRVRGVISGRRVLEVLVGGRGESLKTRKGIKGILNEPVGLFLDEARSVFPDSIALQTILQYMAENAIGYVFVIDSGGIFKGVVNEASILKRLQGKIFNVKAEDIMSRTPHTISPEASLFEASSLLVDTRVRRLPVVVDEKVTGLLTVTDILNHVLVDEKHIELLLYDLDVADVLKDKVREVMSTNIVSTEPWSDVSETIDSVVKNDVSGLLVVSHEGKLLGVVSRIDLIARLTRIKDVSSILDLMAR